LQEQLVVAAFQEWEWAAWVVADSQVNNFTNLSTFAVSQ
jgi:hypothetical protein